MMTSTALLASVLFGGAARAADVEVLVPPFQATDAAGDAVVGELSSAVSSAIAARPGTVVAPLSGVPAIGELAAVDYAASCPPGESVGCAFVLGEAGRVSLAVAGSVGAGEDGRVVAEIHVVDVQQSADLISFSADLAPGTETASFAATVASVVSAAARGDIKAGGDIRAAPVPVDAGDAEKLAAQRQLAQLSQEIGGSDAVGDKGLAALAEEKYTLDKLAQDMETDGAKPWDRVGMKPQEYLRYRNSGMSLYEWRQRQVGRKGQIILRGGGGFGNGPAGGAYFARQGLSEELQPVEVYAWDTMVDQGGVQGTFALSYGILPELEAGVQVGWARGTYTADIDTITVDQYATPGVPQETANSSTWLGAHVFYAPRPVWPARPVLGANFTWYQGRAVDTHIQAADFPTFDAPSVARVGLVPGGEARINDHVDFFLHLPLDFVVGGTDSHDASSGGGVLTPAEKATAKPTGTVHAGVHLGVQVRLLGAEPETRSVSEDPDF